MAYIYPDSTLMANTPLYIFYYLNEVTHGWFANMILIAFYSLILYGYYKATDEFAGGMAIAGFVTFVVALFFWAGAFLSGVTLTIVIAVMIMGVISLLVASN